MNLDVLDGTWTWVWKEPPEPAAFCRGLIVRAANGNGWTDPQGFDYRANYDRWDAAFSGPLIAWTYLYSTSDPVLAAGKLAASPAEGYIVDWEDAAGPAPSGEQLADFVDTLHALVPGVPVGFSSYPTRAQALEHGVDWDRGLEVCDFVAPQAYYDYQVHDYATIIADAKGRYVQLDLEPQASTAWNIDAGEHLGSGSGVSFWRLGILGADTRNRIAGYTGEVALSEATIIKAVNDHADTLFRYGDHGDTTSGHGYSRAVLAERIGDLAGHVDNLTTQVASLAQMVDALTAKVGPAPGGGQVSGTFTATLAGGAPA